MAEPTRRIVRVVETTATGADTTAQLIVNVKTAHGAVGDGVADDTAAIQAAIDAVGLRTSSSMAGGIVYFPQGKYLITSTLELARCITLLGAGQFSSQIKATTDIAMLDNYDAVNGAQDYIQIRDIYIVNSVGSPTKTVLRLRNCHHCEIHNVAINGGDICLDVACAYFVMTSSDLRGGVTAVIRMGSGGIGQTIRDTKVVGLNVAAYGLLYTNDVYGGSTDVYLFENVEFTQIDGWCFYDNSGANGEIHRCDCSAFPNTATAKGGFYIGTAAVRHRNIGSWVEDGTALTTPFYGIYLDEPSNVGIFTPNISLSGGSGKYGIYVYKGGNCNVYDGVFSVSCITTGASAYLDNPSDARFHDCSFGGASPYGVQEVNNPSSSMFKDCRAQSATTKNWEIDKNSSIVDCFDEGVQFSASPGEFTFLTDGDTTPDLLGTHHRTQNTSPTTITDIDHHSYGKIVHITFTDALTTIAHGANIKLKGGKSHTFAVADVITLVDYYGVWYELSRSTNAIATYTAFTSTDTTPSVAVGDRKHFKTANGSGTVISDFNDGVAGQEIWVYINDANTTIDLSGTNLDGNGGADFTAAVGDMLHAICYDGTNWKVLIIDIA